MRVGPRGEEARRQYKTGHHKLSLAIHRLGHSGKSCDGLKITVRESTSLGTRLGLLHCFHTMRPVSRISLSARGTGVHFIPANLRRGRTLAFSPKQQADYGHKTCGKGPRHGHRYKPESLMHYFDRQWRALAPLAPVRILVLWLCKSY